MAKTKIDIIRERLQESYSSEKVKSYIRLSAFAFGEGIDSWDSFATSNESTIVDPIDICPNYLDVGKSRAILANQFVSMSKVMYAQPQPQFVNVDPEIADIRKEFFRLRSTDNKYGTNFQDHFIQTYLDFSSLGIGALILGVTNGVKGQRITCENINITQVIWDRTNVSPKLSKWVGFIKYINYETALELFGQDVWDKYSTYRIPERDYDDLQIKSMRIIEYWDIGFNGGAPTMCIFANDFQGDVLKITDNVYKILPVVFMTNWIPPMCRTPIGSIVKQAAAQLAINEIEDMTRRIVQTGKPCVLIDKSSIDNTDLENYNSGEEITMMGYTPGNTGAPFVRIPPAEISQTSLAYKNDLMREINSQSGVSELEKSNMLETVRSASEIANLQANSQITGAFERKELAAFYKSVIEKLFIIARDFDRDSLIINRNGKDYELNNPDDHTSWIENFIDTDQGEIYVDETSLQFQDHQTESLKKLTVLNQLQPELQMGILDPVEYAKIKLQILGLPSTLIKQEAPMPQTAGLPAMGDLMQLMQQGVPTPQ